MRYRADVANEYAISVPVFSMFTVKEHGVRDALQENRDKSDDDAPLPFSDSDINLADKLIMPGLMLVRQVECSQHPFKPCEIDQSLQLG